MEIELLCHLFVVFLLTSSLILLTATRKRRQLQPPGPWRLPIIGNLHLLTSSPHRSLLTLSRKHGPLMLLQLGSIPTLVVSSRTIAAEIFRDHDLIVSGRPALTAAKRLSYNYSSPSVSPYGEYWRQARKTVTLELLNRRRVRELETVRSEEVAKLVASIKELPLVNLSAEMLSLSNNVVRRVAFGDRYGGGGYGGGGGGWLVDTLSEAQSLLGSFWVGDYFPAMAWIDRLVPGRHARLERNFAEFDRFYDEAIREHLVSMEGEERVEGKSAGAVNENQEDVLHTLLRLHKAATASHQGGFLSSMDHVKGILVDIFIAGTDTSSSTIVWTMAELLRNPRVMHKLQQELHEATHNSSRNEHTVIHERDLEKLDYLKQVIKESLRLHPPAPLLLPRETIGVCEIDGYKVPAKTRVIINAVAISTDPEVWEGPLEFRPERFEGGQVDFKGRHFEYLPFGAGRRMCPGMSFAMALVELAVANLVHCFDWSMPDGIKAEDMDMEEAIGLTVHKKEPLRLVPKSKW